MATLSVSYFIFKGKILDYILDPAICPHRPYLSDFTFSFPSSFPVAATILSRIRNNMTPEETIT